MIVNGTRVVYTRQDTTENQRTGWYPPVGTLGTVTGLGIYGGNNIRVKWDSGTSYPHEWWCSANAVKEADMNNNYILRCKASEGGN